MRTTTTALVAGLALALLSACQKTPEPKTSAADPTPGSSPAVSPAPPGGSVALPADKMPPSDAAVPPVTASADTKGNSGDANTPTQANPSALQKQQEQGTMPHSGQVNNHSVPETTGTGK
ncbi:hypothetical protein [Noviherbaspirillum denitrificans]|uniref:Lipoprotein n=1 Tax=Noviherbaspirillum denitrificans TaxID=1968433 RepID=A0A254TFC1_9BURK|nr:hypothetical protein [Noviherbaspirillum denitrificans]OWW21346.1 hypothetical protein AYR66_19545 [Noviherbaspirillum denitrificans]